MTSCCRWDSCCQFVDGLGEVQAASAHEQLYCIATLATWIAVPPSAIFVNPERRVRVLVQWAADGQLVATPYRFSTPQTTGHLQRGDSASVIDHSLPINHGCGNWGKSIHAQFGGAPADGPWMLDGHRHKREGGRNPHISPESVSFLGPPAGLSHPQIDGKTCQHLDGIFRLLNVLYPPPAYCQGAASYACAVRHRDLGLQGDATSGEYSGNFQPRVRRHTSVGPVLDDSGFHLVHAATVTHVSASPQGGGTNSTQQLGG